MIYIRPLFCLFVLLHNYGTCFINIFILFQQNSISQKISICRTYAYKIYTGYPNIYIYIYLKKNLNLRIKIKPIPAGADATLCVWFLGQIYCTVLYVQYINKSQSYVRVCIQYCCARSRCNRHRFMRSFRFFCPQHNAYLLKQDLLTQKFSI